MTATTDHGTSDGSRHVANARLGWVGAGGRMGSAMAERLVAAGHEVHVFNRTRTKLDELVARGAIAVDHPADLTDCSIVFITVGSDADLIEVVDGGRGIASTSNGSGPEVVIDLTTVSAAMSATIRRTLDARGIAFVAAPVSGNAKVVRAGLMSIVASGPRSAFDQALPYLDVLARRVVYVGEGEQARFVKICHNLYLGMVIQALVEVAVLAEKAGISRHDMLEFINTSVMGSVFSRYKTPALVNLDFAPTFTLELLLKDIMLAMDAAEELDVPLQLGSRVRAIVEAAIEEGHGSEDFAVLVAVAGRAAGMDLRPEDVEVATGLEPIELPPPDPVSAP